MVREIPLNRGKIVLVDNEDYELVNSYNWYAWRQEHRNTFYARCNINIGDSIRTSKLMHQLITGYKQTDHINGNGLDNRRENLRNVTVSQNNRNVLKTKKLTSSRYKGVHWSKIKQKWHARISINDKQKHIGYFVDEMSAARAYDSYLRFYFGEFGTYNFPKENERGAL